MPGVVFDTYLDHILDGYQWTTANVYGMLVLADTWTPAKGDIVVDDAILAGAIEVVAASYVRVPLVSPIKNLDTGGHRGLLDASVIDFGILESGFDFDTLILFEMITDDSDSWMLCTQDLGAQTTDGVTPERCVPNTDGLFQITAP